jgi:hypothetical protein
MGFTLAKSQSSADHDGKTQTYSVALLVLMRQVQPVKSLALLLALTCNMQVRI